MNRLLCQSSIINILYTNPTQETEIVRLGLAQRTFSPIRTHSLIGLFSGPIFQSDCKGLIVYLIETFKKIGLNKIFFVKTY